MKSIKIGSKSYNLDFTFNSFKYLQDFNINDLNDINNYPFKIFNILNKLFYGALNCHIDKVYTVEESEALLEKYSEKEDVYELFNTLMMLLEESRFFKNLQNKNNPQ